MKFIFILLVSLFLIKISNGCQTCVDIGGECSGKSCKGSLYCGYEPTATVYNGTQLCYKAQGLGQQCYDNEVCTYGTRCYKANSSDKIGTCLEIKFALIGESCANTSQCVSSYATCEDGKCVKTSNVCKNEDDCPSKQFCNAGQCQNTVGLNDKCGSDSECGVVAFCSSGICRDFFSLQEGEICGSMNDYPDYNFKCDNTKDLYCSKETFSCTPFGYTPPTNGSCTANNQCGSSTFGSCDCGTGKCFNTKQISNVEKNTFINFMNCMNDNCGKSYGGFEKDSCSVQKCGPQFCDYYTQRMIHDNDCGILDLVKSLICEVSNSSKLLPSFVILLLSFFLYLF